MDSNQMEVFHESEEDDTVEANEDEIQENKEPSGDASQVIKPKRVIKNPLPKLDATRLMGPRGIVSLQSSFRNTKFKGKGYEKEDLTMVMKKLEHWAHRLFPKLQFDDTLKQIEKLGTKKPVQNMMKRIRLDMFQSDEMTEKQDEENVDRGRLSDEENVDRMPVLETRRLSDERNDVFDGLLRSMPVVDSSRSTEAPMSQSVVDNHPGKVTTLTEEQRERMQRNRILALERRKVRMQKLENSHSPAQGDVSRNTDEKMAKLSQSAGNPREENLELNRSRNVEDSSLPLRKQINDSSNLGNCDVGTVATTEPNIEVLDVEMDEPNVQLPEGSNLSNADQVKSSTHLGVPLSSNIPSTSGSELEMPNENNIFTEDDVLSLVYTTEN